MVVVRESPRAKLSPEKNTAQWPPKSPFQALLSSPSGRRKWQEHRGRGGDRTPSPSPLRKPFGGSKALRELSVSEDDGDDDEEEEEEEDEETVRLRLQEIQAKLKLKRLRQKAKREVPGSEGQSDSIPQTTSRADSPPTSPRKSTKPSIPPPRPREEAVEIEVPLSPIKNRNPPKAQTSPARARLGLNPAFKAQDVSLKRARDGTQLQRRHNRPDEDVFGAAKPASFSDRLAQSRLTSRDERAKRERVEKARGKGFGGDRGSVGDVQSSDGFGERATSRRTDDATRPASAQRVRASSQLDGEGTVSRSASTRSSRPEEQSNPRPNAISTFTTHPQTSIPNDTPAADDHNNDSSLPISAPEQDPPPSFFEPISQLHLSKRHIPHPDLTHAMSGKELYTLPRLLKEVTAPHYDPPDCESDFVLFAILASKSNPFDQKASHRTSDEHKVQENADVPRNKFMVLHLCDLKWEVDCFLFGTAFDQFWKLTPGTLLAILNPSVMPPKTNQQHSGRFSLKLGSSEDCVMEIGVARDLGYCGSVRRDGRLCGQWIDRGRTEICEVHLDMIVGRERKGRMEVNGMWRGVSKNVIGGERTKSSGREKAGFDHKNKNPTSTYHREYGNVYSVPSSTTSSYATKSAATLLDAEDMSVLHNISASEASRKRIAAAQRERDLAQRLGEMGNSVGAEYMRARTRNNTNTISTTNTRSGDVSAEGAKKALFEKPSAAELGLLGKKAGEQRLSPGKDRKRHFGVGAMSREGVGALGWGGAKRAGLLLPKANSRLDSPEKGQRRLDDARGGAGIVRGQEGSGGLLQGRRKKRARFALEKGIREPGRESLGEELLKVGEGTADDEDEDELDIVV